MRTTGLIASIRLSKKLRYRDATRDTPPQFLQSGGVQASVDTDFEATHIPHNHTLQKV